MTYINYINGLRGISIILVLFYHLFDTNIFRNGFLGVDFFFVISGFILTYKYYTEQISLRVFFYNRFKRLIPSLVLCLIFVYLILTLLIKDALILSENFNLIKSTLFFYNNFYLLNTINYFNSNIENYLTYHLWSLSIEEQFYIIFPFLILLGKNFYKALIIIFILLLSIYLYQNTIQFPSELIENNNLTLVADNFFSPTLRFIELIIGCFSAIIVKSISGNILRNKILNNSINILGVSLLTYILFFYNFSMDYHPGFITILISLIISIIIINLFFTPQSYLLKTLNSWILQFFGNISYTLYLFHVPLFFLLNYYLKESLVNNIFIVSMIIFVSFVIWKFYEYPIYKGQINSKFLLIFPFLYVALITFTYWNLNDNKVNANKTQNYLFQEIIDENKTDNKCFISNTFRKKNNDCFSVKDKNNIIVFWGDSYASALAMIFQKNFKEYDVVTFTSSNCAPRFYSNDYNSFDGIYCEINNKLATNFIKKNQNSIIRVLVHSSAQLDQFKPDVVEEFNFHAIGPSPIWGSNMTDFLTENSSETNTFISYGLRTDILLSENRIRNYFKKFNNVKYISLQDFLCEINGDLNSEEVLPKNSSIAECLAIINYNDKIFPYSYDMGHISFNAGEYLFNSYLYDKIFK